MRKKKNKNPKTFTINTSMASLCIFFRRLAFTVVLLSSLLSPSHQADVCSSQTFTKNRLFQHCNDLPFLKSYLHWSYDQSKSTLSIAFIAPPSKPDGWVSWALNPTGQGMIGAQSLIAFKDSTGGMSVKSYNISSYASISESKVWFDVKDSSAEFGDGVIRLFATLVLPNTAGMKINQVWQVGGSVTNGVPDKHDFQPANLNAKGTLDLLSGVTNTTGDGSVESRIKRKNIHGILNVVSWGILFPVGILIARFLKQFESADPAWFYLHAFCQLSGYVIGVAGWGTGLKLGSESKGIQYSLHRNVGIALFSLATVQIFALFLRPKKDHKYRFYWNIYHHGLGYIIVGLSIYNIFKGLDILLPAKKWRNAYIVYLIVLAVVAVLLQVISLVLTMRRRSRKSSKTQNGFGDT